MKNKKVLGLFALGIVVLMGIGFVAAYHGDNSGKGPNYSEERHEAIEKSFDNLDYNAWLALMTEGERHPRVVDVVTEDNFATFVEIHEARESGNFEKVLELRAELGLGQGKIAGGRGADFDGSEMHKMNKGFGMRSQGSCFYSK